MTRNTVQFQKGLSEAEFRKLYGTEELCRAFVFKLRWPDGFVCPGCGGRAHCVITTAKSTTATPANCRPGSPPGPFSLPPNSG